MVYGVGVVFGVSVDPDHAVRPLPRLLSGKIDEDELVMIKESEEPEASRAEHELHEQARRARHRDRRRRSTDGRPP